MEFALYSVLLVIFSFDHALGFDELPYLEYQTEVGASITLDCQTKHTTFKSLSWYRNDTGLLATKSGDTVTIHVKAASHHFGLVGRDLLINISQSTDEGFYYCVTENETDELEGKYIKLILEERPNCGKVEVSEQLVINGTTFYMPCTVKGHPYPTISWVKIGASKLPSHLQVTEKGLKFNDVKMSDAGKYGVTLSSLAGKYVFFTTLEVMSVASIKPENYKSVLEHKSVAIECGNKNPSPKEVKWTKERVDLSMVKRFSVNATGFLVINPTLRNDTGLYTCTSQLETEFGKVTLAVNMYLNVKYAPGIITIRSLVEVDEGQDALLPCLAAGNPGVNFRWLLPNGARIKNNRYTIAHNGSLIVRSVSLRDVMNYTCAPYNIIGEGRFGYTYLNMLSIPKFLSFPNTLVRTREGRNVTLDCSASGIPQPIVVWYHSNEPIRRARFLANSNGVLTIVHVQGNDTGMYKCMASSRAGKSIRMWNITVVGLPGVPTSLNARTQHNTIKVHWIPSYKGGSPLLHQFWYRYTTDTDYEWKTKEAGRLNNTSYNFTLSGSDVYTVEYYVSMRVRNEEGYSGFSGLLKVLSTTDGVAHSETVAEISDFPLAPDAFSATVSKNGYTLTWTNLETPGRPYPVRTIVKYRQQNTTNWVEVVKKWAGRSRRSNRGTAMALTPDDFPPNVVHPVDFIAVSVAANGKESKPASPRGGVIINGGIPGGNVPDKGKPVNKTNTDDNLPPIVLGVIFGLFLIVLVISLCCFCRKRKGRYRAGKNQKKADAYNTANCVDLEMESADHLIKPDSPRKFHLRTCPALKLGRISENHGFYMDDGNENEAHMLIEPNAQVEKRLCTCSKNYVTLDRRDQISKREKKKALYKSTSSPSVLLASDVEESNVDPIELLDEEGYDINDKVTEVKNKHSLKRSKFKDSYDQFCRTDCHELRNNSSLRKKRQSSNDRTEVDKDHLDNSSENSATESERPVTPKPCGSKGNVSNGAKSSGFGDGSNSTSDSESILEKPILLKPRTMGYMSDTRGDIGYASDVSARSSTLDFNTRPKYLPPSQRHRYAYNRYEFFSDDERPKERPLMPPSYNQAIHDIERLSEKNDVTDSEEMYDHLLQMERQLGVNLDDSVESELNTKALYPGRAHSKNDYSSDVGCLSDSHNRERYTDREKTERCKQLLSEFKSTRSESESEAPVAPPYDRSKSVMNDITEEPRVPPVLRRSNSAGNSSVYKEWLV